MVHVTLLSPRETEKKVPKRTVQIRLVYYAKTIAQTPAARATKLEEIPIQRLAELRANVPGEVAGV